MVLNPQLNLIFDPLVTINNNWHLRFFMKFYVVLNLQLKLFFCLPVMVNNNQPLNICCEILSGTKYTTKITILPISNYQ